MPDLFVAMFREEWRVHSELFGSVGFALFPVLVGAMACMGTVLVPIVNAALPAGDLATIVHLLFLLVGVMVGGFGLVGNEAMNRRFGQASFVAYAARTLPVSERRIFAAFVAKDTVYYLLLWILPVIAGVALASPFAGLAPATVLRLALTLLLAFLSGLAGVFLITTVWGRSKVAFAVLAGVLVAGVRCGRPRHRRAPAVPAARALPFVLVDPSRRDPRRDRGRARGLAPALPTGLGRERTAAPGPILRPRPPPRPVALPGARGQGPARPLAERRRCRAGALRAPPPARPLLVPDLAPRASVLPPNGVLLLFAVLAGVLGSTVYTWLTAFDAFGPYGCLPGRRRDADPVEAHLVRPAPGHPGRRRRRRRPRGGRRRSRPARRRNRARALGLGSRGHGLPRRALAERAGLRPEGPRGIPRRRRACPIIALVVLAFASPWLGLAALLLLVPAAFLVSAGVRRWEAADGAFF